VSRSGGPYSRAEVDLLNARRAGPQVEIDEITRVFRGDLDRVLAWFEPKSMPEGWAVRLQQHFTTTEPLVVAFGYPGDVPDFFVVHDLPMRTLVECAVPTDRVAPAGTERSRVQPLPGADLR